ncbi:unnamed protein product [Alopecurus aequalis]
MGKHSDSAMTPEKAMQRIEALSDLLVTIAQGVAEEERDGAAEAAGHNDDRSLDRLTWPPRRSFSGSPSTAWPAKEVPGGLPDWTSSSSTGDNGAEPKPPPSTSS